MNRIYLAVPFVEKDEAKSFGAKWDGECKKWYCEKNNKNYIVGKMEKWKINDTPNEFIGEDREFGGNTSRINCIECCNKIYNPEEIKLLTNNDTVYCGNCKCYLPKTDFHGSTLRLSNIKICNTCKKTIKENIKISNEKKKYSCKSCKKYFENGNGLIRFRFTNYVDCKKYKLELSRCDGCYRKGNYEDSQIILTGGKIGDIPDQQLF